MIAQGEGERRGDTTARENLAQRVRRSAAIHWKNYVASEEWKDCAPGATYELTSSQVASNYIFFEYICWPICAYQAVLEWAQIGLRKVSGEVIRPLSRPSLTRSQTFPWDGTRKRRFFDRRPDQSPGEH